MKKYRESTLARIIIYQILISQERNSYKTTPKEKCINISDWNSTDESHGFHKTVCFLCRPA